MRTFFFSLTFFLFVGFLFNSYAINVNSQYDIIEVYDDFDAFSTTSTGVPGKHSHKSQGFQLADFAGNMADVIYPQGNVRYAQIVEDPNISTGAKLGLLGAIDIPLSALLYNPPYVDVPEHLAQEWIPNYDQTAGVYADPGYSQLMTSNINVLWSFARNIAYMMFVIVFIVAGFMIMFRHKLGGQAMVTLYNTLPNVVVGLILVTFSFAIVGFMIDIGAMLINVIDGLLGVDGSVDPISPVGVWWAYIGDIVGQSIVQSFTRDLVGMLVSVAAIVLAPFITILVILAIVIIILYASIKIFFTLIKAYIGILLNTATAPIVFAIAAIPGKQTVMKDWFNRVAKNVATFVVVFFLVNLPLFLMNNFAEGMNLFGGDLGTGRSQSQIVTSIIMTGIAIYILFLAANVPKMLEDYFPQTAGKGGAEAAAGAKKDMSKIPLIGGFFKG